MSRPAGGIGIGSWFAARTAMGAVLGGMMGLFPLGSLVAGGVIPAALGMPGALGAAAAVLIEGLPAALAGLWSNWTIGLQGMVRLVSDAATPVVVALLRRRGWEVSRAARVVGAIGVGATSSALAVSLLPLTGALESALAVVGGGGSPVPPPGADPWDLVGMTAAAAVVALMLVEVAAVPALLVASLLRLQGAAADLAEGISGILTPEESGMPFFERPEPPNPHRDSETRSSLSFSREKPAIIGCR